MKKSSAIYYIVVSLFFIFAISGYDFFNLATQVIPIFITEFAAILITYVHLFYLQWNKRTPVFFHKKNINLKILSAYLFFYIWAALILVNKNYLLTLFIFIISLSTKGLNIHFMSSKSTDLRKDIKLSVIQFGAIVLSVFFGLFLSASVPDMTKANLVWGLLYYGISSVLIFLF